MRRPDQGWRPRTQAPIRAARQWQQESWPTDVEARSSLTRRDELRASEVAAPPLLALDRLEQRLEVAGSEPLGALPLDHFEEDRGPVAHVLGEQLKEIPVLVLVDENT